VADLHSPAPRAAGPAITGRLPGATRLLAAQVRYQLLLLARNPRAMILSLAFPLLILVLNSTARHDVGPPLETALVAGLATFGLTLGALAWAAIGTAVTALIPTAQSAGPPGRSSAGHPRRCSTAAAGSRLSPAGISRCSPPGPRWARSRRSASSGGTWPGHSTRTPRPERPSSQGRRPGRGRRARRGGRA
jgi:hypothetical protein